MALSDEEVQHVARLARVALSTSERDQLRGQLSDILAYAEQVGEVAAEDVPPTSHPYPLVNVDRADDPRPSLDREAVLSQAPRAEQQRFRVPRILGEAPDGEEA
nr:Asp-tRNA(Asn)/Glu-tRNA(Gln) amidotransferase subunit GatC [Egibacter rhizosphaerae]